MEVPHASKARKEVNARQRFFEVTTKSRQFFSKNASCKIEISIFISHFDNFTNQFIDFKRHILKLNIQKVCKKS